MAQEKVLGNQLNITDVATETANNATAIGTVSSGIVSDPTALSAMEAGIDHANLGAGIGTNSHPQVDAHIADATLHFTEASIIHQNISGAGTNDHTAIDAHIASFDLHLIPNQNAYLDGLTLTGSPALTATDTNQLIGITGNVQALIDAVAGNLTTHEGDMVVHMTVDQNAFMDGLTLTGSPALASIDVDQLIGITGNVQAQIDLKADNIALTSHTSNVTNPHAVTQAQVGLGNVDNTSDINKPISTLTQSALDLKTNKVLTTVVGNFASFSDVTGTQQDSTVSATSFATAAQGTASDAHIINTTNPHSTTLDLLTNVNVAGASLGQVLTLVGSPPVWTAQTPTTGGVTNPMTADLNTGGYKIITSDVASGTANAVMIYGGNITNAAATHPGDVLVYAGNAPAGLNTNNYNSGEIFLRAGYMQPYGTGTGLKGGGVSIYGGYGYGSVVGGAVRIEAGGTVSGTGGFMQVSGGSSTSGNGGGLGLYSGASNTLASGNITIAPGDTASGTSGTVTLRGGSATGGSNGGDLILKSGSGTIEGNVVIQGSTTLSDAKVHIHSGTNNKDVVLSTGTLTADTLFQFPLNNGSNGKPLTVDGTGVTSWSGPPLFSGTGSPETVVTAPVGAMYTDDAGGANTTLYIKESGVGNTGWVAK